MNAAIDPKDYVMAVPVKWAIVLLDSSWLGCGRYYFTRDYAKRPSLRGPVASLFLAESLCGWTRDPANATAYSSVTAADRDRRRYGVDRNTLAIPVMGL